MFLKDLYCKTRKQPEIVWERIELKSFPKKKIICTQMLPFAFWEVTIHRGIRSKFSIVYSKAFFHTVDNTWGRVVMGLSFSCRIWSVDDYPNKLQLIDWYWPFLKQALIFTCLQYMSIENNVGKEEIARNEQFLLFPRCFLPVWRTFCHFHQIQNCRLQSLSVWSSLKFVVWERVK